MDELSESKQNSIIGAPGGSFDFRIYRTGGRNV